MLSEDASPRSVTPFLAFVLPLSLVAVAVLGGCLAIVIRRRTKLQMKKFDIQLGAKTTQTCHVKSVFEPLPVITFIHFHLVSLIHLLLSPAAHENVLFF